MKAAPHEFKRFMELPPELSLPESPPRGKKMCYVDPIGDVEALEEDYMKRCHLITLLGAAAIVIAQPPAVAQPLLTYSCLDGSEFIVAFFAGERSAHLQLDGKAISLPRRLSLSGTRYAKGDITLSITKAVTTLKRGKRSTECTAA